MIQKQNEVAKKVPAKSLREKMGRFSAKQAGVTLIEALIVLGVAAGIIGGVWVAAQSANDEQIAQQDGKEVAALVTNMRRIYNGAGYSAMTAATVAAANGLPSGMRVTGTSFYTSNNSVIGLTVAAGAGQTFSIRYGDANTTKSSCMAIAKSVAAAAMVVNAGAAVVNGVAGAAPTGGTVYKASSSAQPVHANLLTGCNATGGMVAAQFQ